MSAITKPHRNVTELIEELRRKIQLLEGDRKAYYESAEWTMKEDRAYVTKLRSEIKHSQMLLAYRLAADEHVINKGLEQCPVERNALRDKPGSIAIVKMDEKVRDKVNILNNLKYETTKLQKKYASLETQLAQMKKEAALAESTDAGESEDAQVLRTLENRLDKANLKCQEAEHIRKTYIQIKEKLEEEHKSYENILCESETEIKKCRHELKDLKVMNNDAQIARDAAKAELEKQERQVYAERRKRELELAKVRKEAEEKKIQHERVERRLARAGSIAPDEMSGGAERALGAEEDRISSYEEAFRRIKEATGVSDTKEVVLRFENQGATREHLEDLRYDNEKLASRLLEERESLRAQFEEMKYSGEAKLSSGQRLLEEFQNHLTDEESKRNEAEQKLEKSSKILTDVRSGVEHLSEKLKYLKAPQSSVQKAKILPTSDEYVLDQLSIAEEKLLKLMEELDGRDLTQIVQQMDEEEFHNTADIKLPSYNTRVKLPQTQKDKMYDDEDESGEDEDVLTRQSIKKQSQQIIEAKTRRKGGKRKKKAK